MAMLCESRKKPPRTKVICSSFGSSDRREIQRDIKATLPFSGYVSSGFVPKADANNFSDVVPDSDKRVLKPKAGGSQCRRSYSFTAKACPGEAELQDVHRFFRDFSPPLTVLSTWTRRRPCLTNASLTEHPGTCR